MLVFLYFTSVMAMLFLYGFVIWPFVHIGLYAFIAWASRRLNRLFGGQKTDAAGEPIPLDGGYWYVGLWTLTGLLGGLYLLGWTVISISGGWGWATSVQFQPKPTVWLALIGLPLLGTIDFYAARTVIPSAKKWLRIVCRILLFLSLLPFSFIITPILGYGLLILYGWHKYFLFGNLAGCVFMDLMYSYLGIYILAVLFLLMLEALLLYLRKKNKGIVVQTLFWTFMAALTFVAIVGSWILVRYYLNSPVFVLVNESGDHLAFLPDETGLVYSSFNDLNIWNFQDRKSVPLKLSSKTGDNSAITGLWVGENPANPKCIAIKIFQRGRLLPLAYYPDEKRVEVLPAIPLEGKEPTKDAESTKEEETTKEGNPTILTQCVFSPDGTRALCFDQSTAELGLWDAQTGKLIFQPDWNKLFHLPEPSKDYLIRAVKFSSDGKLWGAAVGGRAFTKFPDTAFVWETDSDTVLMSWKPDSGNTKQTSEMETMALSRSDQKSQRPILAVVTSVNYSNIPEHLYDFSLIEVQNRQLLGLISVGPQISTIEFSPQERTYIDSYSCYNTAFIEIKTLEDQRTLRTISPPYYDVVKNPVVQNIVFSPSGKLFAVTINCSTLLYSLSE